MAKTYNLVISDDARDSLEHYGKTLKQLKRVQSSIASLKEESDKADAEAKDAASCLSGSRFSPVHNVESDEWDRFSEACEKQSATRLSLSDANTVVDSLVKSLVSTACAYIARVTVDNREMIDGVPLHYKKASDFFAAVASPMDGISTGIERYGVRVTFSRRYSIYGIVDLAKYSDDTANADEINLNRYSLGFSLAEIRKALKRYHSATDRNGEIDRARKAYKEKIDAIQEATCPLYIDRMSDEVSRRASINF